MAGGIDWFRWHHGSITDPKFPLIASKAKARFGDVVAVWAFLLEKASAEADRGYIGPVDFETLDFMLTAEEGTSVRILDAMTARGLIEGNRIAAWDKRQPKRERDTDNSAERTRAYRERQKSHGDDSESRVTPSDAKEHQRNARGEERREEEKTPTDVGVAPLKRATKRCPASFSPTPGLMAWASAEFPSVDVAAATAKLRDHTFGTARTDWPATWRNWIRSESEFKASRGVPAADVRTTTVPAKPGKDPTLQRLEADALTAAPVPQATREFLAKLKPSGATQ